MHPAIPANYPQVMEAKISVLNHIHTKKSSLAVNYTLHRRETGGLYSWWCQTQEVHIVKKYSSKCIKGILHNLFTILMLINVYLQELPRQHSNIAPGSKRDTSSQNFSDIKITRQGNDFNVGFRRAPGKLFSNPTSNNKKESQRIILNFTPGKYSK